MASHDSTRKATVLSTLCQEAFSASVRRKGAEYQALGRVKLDLKELDAGVASAQVRGQQRDPYFVNLRFVEKKSAKLMVYCDCPYFGGGDFCKHIWAAILELDAEQAAPRTLQDYGKVFVLSDPELLDEGYHDYEHDEEDELDELDEDFDDDGEGDEDDVELAEALNQLASVGDATAIAAALRTLELSHKAAGPSGAARSAGKQPDWQTHLDQIRRKIATTTAVAPVPRAAAPEKTPRVWYYLDLNRSQSTGLLSVTPVIRELKKNGQYGKPRRYYNGSNHPSQFAAEDAEILTLLMGATLGSTGYRSYGYGYAYSDATMQINPPMVDLTLPRMAASGRFGWSHGNGLDAEELKPLTWDAGEPWRFELAMAAANEGRSWCVTGSLRRGDESVALDKPLLLLSSGLVIFPDSVARFDAGGAFGWIAALRANPKLEVPAEQADQLVEQLLQMPFLPPLELPEELAWKQVRPTPRPQLRFLRTKTNYPTQKLPATVSFQYGEFCVPLSESRSAVVDRAEHSIVVRDLPREQELLQSLASHGFKEPKYRYGNTNYDVELPAKRLAAVVADLVRADWHVEAEGLKIRRPGDFHMSVASGVDWFDLSGQFDFGGVTASLPQLLAAVRRGEKFVALDDGSHGMLPEEWLAKYGKLADLGHAEGDTLRFVPSQAALLDALLAAQPEAEVDAAFEQMRDRLHSFQGIAPKEPPADFVGSLRDYQKLGLGWLEFLQEFRFGGCLADDMGLGKTVQVLAMLHERRTRPVDAKQPRKPSLVVVPRSLVYNWIEEAKRFTPELRVLNYTGLDRTGGLEKLDEIDLIITTYGTLRRDILQFKELPLDYAILDEAQAIKNASSQAAKSCRLLVADHRLAMSGTPIENHLGELWSLFEFLNPGMLGRSSTLKVLSGSKSGSTDEDFRSLLAQSLRPFLLRRTKEQVLKELPEKTEQTLYCELDRTQRKLYDELRDHYRMALDERIAKVGIKKAKIHVLEALLRLRQAACHPGLLDKTKAGQPSAKLETLLEQLGEVLSEGHKALVFSQFTSLLSLVRKRLDEQGIVYEYLDGKTRDRQQRVERFQTDPDCPLFLISLKAGGQGLNLTAADYVFILDPWWNPAVEAQAVDRAHRIGQNRRVFAYRLIARDTVEEKILELQGAKRQLAEAIISADNSLISSLTADDLRLLLS